MTALEYVKNTEKGEITEGRLNLANELEGIEIHPVEEIHIIEEPEICIVPVEYVKEP